ncbi:Chondroitin sulfate synthase 2 [Chelonia mydas]|uniref:Hexosyltransferase n=1 Tax=Chelonia mydas TaxID=8469 RepID=M7B228_CHEMY|nr:Chondroitin sulfate synthase 2 [Chelonia mydas]
MTVVTHGDERPIWNMYQTVKYMLDHYVGDFDWFYLVQDDTYTEAHRISRLVAHLSIDTLLYLGRPEEFIGGDTERRYCYGGFGYLLSRSLLLRLQPHLENCSFVSTPVNGRTLVFQDGIQYQGLRYQYFELGKNTDPERESDPRFQSAFTAHPVLDPVQMYRLHKHFAQVELERTYQEIQQLQLEIQNTSSLSADGDHGATWPIGITPPFQPKTRFEVLRWDYFTEEQLYSCVDGSPKCELRGVDMADVADVVAVEGVRQKGHSRSVIKRVHLVRPLSEVEIIPMPYVTEASRINVILPLTAHDRDHASHFLEVYAAAAFESSENAVLTFLFIYDPFEAQQVAQNDIFAPVKARIAEYERKYTEVKIPWISVKTDAPSQIKVMDIISKKHPVDTLFFVASVDTEGYNPAIAYHNQALPAALDLMRDAGRFDRDVFHEACFYNADYMAARTRMAGDAQENEDILETLEIYDMFIKYSGLHVFRAMEPALLQRYRQHLCNPRLSEEIYHRCMQSNLEGLGSRSQLAMVLFEQEQGNST